MGVDRSPAPRLWSAPGTCPRWGHQSGEPLSHAAVLETPPGPWPAASSFLPLHESACLTQARAPAGLVMSGPLEAFVLRKKVSRVSNWRKHLNADTYIFPSLVSQGSGGQHAHLRPRKCCWGWEVGPGPARHTAAKAPGLFLPLLFFRPAAGCRAACASL